MTEIAEMATTTCLIREMIINAFISDWKLHMDFLLKKKKKMMFDL